jgi:hypothetical protein
MKHHHLKLWPQFFADIARGARKHDLRVNDRDYEAGDTATLSVWDPATGKYDGRGLDVVITHVFSFVDIDTKLKSGLGLNPCLGGINQLVILSIEVSS